MKDKKAVKIASDLLYTIMATAVMNVVLQLIVYPLVTHFYGENTTGIILTFIGYIYIIPQAFGTALSNSRLVLRKNSDVSNSDFKNPIIISSVITALSCGFISLKNEMTVPFTILYVTFSVVYFLRTYAQVEFRTSLKFKEYFLYYCLISGGYLIGLSLYFVTDIWILIFITGELVALSYSFIKGNIFRKDKHSKEKSKINRTFLTLAISNLARDCVTQFDKVILKEAIGGAAVTHYHVVSLIAKTMQMLVSPINTLLLSYFTVKGTIFTRKTMLKFTVIAFAVGSLFYGACIVGTPIYLKLFFVPSIYDAVIKYNFVVNAGLILGFIASIFMALLVSQGRTTLNMIIEFVWGSLYIIFAHILINKYQIWGLAQITLLMNFIKLILAIGCLLVKTPSPKK